MTIIDWLGSWRKRWRGRKSFTATSVAPAREPDTTWDYAIIRAILVRLVRAQERSLTTEYEYREKFGHAPGEDNPMNPPRIGADYTTRADYQKGYARTHRDIINERKRAWRKERKAEKARADQERLDVRISKNHLVRDLILLSIQKHLPRMVIRAQNQKISGGNY